MSIHAENHAAAADVCQPNGVRLLALPVALVASTIIASTAALWIARAHRRSDRRSQAIKLVTEQSYLFCAESIKSAETWLTPEPSVSFPLVITSVFGRLHRFKPFGDGLFAVKIAQSINSLCNLGNKIKSIILGFNVCAVGIVKPSNKPFARNLVFWMARHKESPFGVFDRQRMDDGGRRGNAPPNAAYGKVAEKQSGVEV